MAMKALVMLKRKAGISFEEFRDHYETSHAKLGEKYFGPYLSEYRRNYCPEAVSLEVPPVAGSVGYDCITELVFKEGHDITDLSAASADPEVRQLFSDDEERFLDRAGCRVAIVEVVESDPR